MRSQGVSRDRLPYRAPLQPYATWLAMVIIILILIFCGFSAFTPVWSYCEPTTFVPPADPPAAFLTNYLNILVFIPAWIIVKLIRRDRLTRSDEMDFDEPLRAWEEEKAVDADKIYGKLSRWERILNKVL